MLNYHCQPSKVVPSVLIHKLMFILQPHILALPWHSQKVQSLSSRSHLNTLGLARLSNWLYRAAHACSKTQTSVSYRKLLQQSRANTALLWDTVRL